MKLSLCIYSYLCDCNDKEKELYEWKTYEEKDNIPEVLEMKCRCGRCNMATLNSVETI